MSVRMLRPGATDRTDRALVELIDRWEGSSRGSGSGSTSDHLRNWRRERTAWSAPPGSIRRPMIPSDGVSARSPGCSGSAGTGPLAGADGTKSVRGYASPGPSAPTLLPWRASATYPGRHLGSFRARRELGSRRRSRGRASIGEPRELRRSLLLAAAMPVEAGALLHFPGVDGVQRDAPRIPRSTCVDLVASDESADLQRAKQGRAGSSRTCSESILAAELVAHQRSFGWFPPG